MAFTAMDRIIKAKVTLLMTNPFFSFLTFKLTVKEDPKCPTMGVDRLGNMFFNSDFVTSLTDQELIGVICHEVMHVALMHLNFLGSRNPTIANIAQDIVINDILIENHFYLPKGGIIPTNHEVSIPGGKKPIIIKEINRKGWQQIYNELISQLPPDQKNPGFDVHIYGSDPGSEEGKKEEAQAEKMGMTEQDLQQALNEAYAHAKMQGHAPCGLDRLIEELNYPTLPWRQMLQKFIIRELPFDFSFMRPSRKSVATGVYMPSVTREQLEIAIGVDTSGSMSTDDLKECVSEVMGILKAYDNVTLNILACDTEVHVAENIKSEEDLAKFNWKGGGGTDFIPVFKWIEENKPMTKLLIFFTDGYGDFPESTQLHTLWCITDGGLELDKIPFGEKVRLEPFNRKK